MAWWPGGEVRHDKNDMSIHISVCMYVRTYVSVSFRDGAEAEKLQGLQGSRVVKWRQGKAGEGFASKL